MNFERLNSNQEKVKINYLTELEKIKNNNEFLSNIAERFLERPDLINLVKVCEDKNLNAYGKNSIENSEVDEKIKIKGITINPNHKSSELLVHELVHFYSMPALDSATKSLLEGAQTTPAFKKYLHDLGKFDHIAKKSNYSITNSHSMDKNMEEFAVNFTNKESAKILKEINIYDDMVNSFFEMYNSFGIRNE